MKRKKVISAIILVAILCTLVFGVASASWTSTRQICKKPYGSGPTVCLKANFQVSGGAVKITAKWETKEYVPGWTVVTNVAPYQNVTGYTTGVASVGAGWTWYYNGQRLIFKSCAHGGDAVRNKLQWAHACQ